MQRIPRHDEAVRRVGLELHRIGSGVGSRIHETMSLFHVAIVIDADLGNDEGRRAVADAPALNIERTHRNHG